MCVEIEVIGGIEKIIQSIEASQAKITKATVRALNKTALWTKEQATKELSKDKQIKRQLRACPQTIKFKHIPSLTSIYS